MPNPFKSFWMAGFECTDQLNAFGNRVDFVDITAHLDKLSEDYQHIGLFNMRTAREGIRWSQVEKRPYEYEWGNVAAMIQQAKKNNIQLIWDLCHFGYPDDLTPLHPHFTGRFGAFCEAFVRFYRSVDKDGVLIITPINEVSFISWLGGEVAGTSPYCKGMGWEVKYALMRAYIRCIQKVKAMDVNVRILTTEPLVNMVPPLNATAEQTGFAMLQHEQQFQVLDILSGSVCPELGGRPEYLDILGFNYYYNNQWIAGTSDCLSWKNELDDSRWQPLSYLLSQVYNRYQRPLVLSETSHPGEDRALWMNFIAAECAIVLDENIPLWGVCWYPVIDRPDWDHLAPWHHSGLWDITDSASRERLLHGPSAEALVNAQQLIPNPIMNQMESIRL